MENLLYDTINYVFIGIKTKGRIMNKQLVAILTIFIVLSVCLSGCEDKKDVFVGTTWQTDLEIDKYQEEMTWSFYSNNTFKILHAPTGNYEEDTRTYWNNYYLTDDQICYYPSDSDKTDESTLCFFYEFYNEGTNLQLFQDPESPAIIKTMTFKKIR